MDAVTSVDLDRLAKDIAAGQRKLHELPEELTSDEAAQVRRRGLEHRVGTGLRSIGDYTMDLSKARVENLIGAVQVPLGVVGPLTIRGTEVGPDEAVYAPLATSEGALIASIARGCRAMREGGGAVVDVEDIGMTRAPVFRTEGIAQTRAFLDWVARNHASIRALAESTSHHLRLLEIKPQHVANTVYLRFRFECGDAMGMNMVTVACDRVIQELIVPATGVTCIALSGNYCTDKKPAMVNFMEGRGKRISAEVTLSRDVLERCLKTSAAALVEVQYRKNLLGSIMAGSLGFNAHFANIVAAFFLATGQDVAQVVEGALGITTIEARDDGGVYASVHMPDVPLAAVGGGTVLGAQREALALVGALPDHRTPGRAVRRLAEVLGTLVLAGELSILSAMAAHHLASAHQRLGRPVSR